MPVTDPRRRSTIYRHRLSEIKHMQRLVTEETMYSTLEMLKLFEQSQDAGVRTLGLLHHQGEQLNRVGGDLDNINVDVSMANRDLKQLELAEDGWFCCSFCCCCRRRKKVRNSIYESSVSDSSIKDKKAVTPAPKIVKPGHHVDGSNSPLTDDEKIDRNLALVFDTLLGLKTHADEIGKVVTAQNSQIDGLNTKAMTDQDKLKSANKRAGRLLN